MIGHTLGTGKYGVVVGQGHAASGFSAKLRGVDGANASDQAVSRAHFQQLSVRAAAALGGERKAAVFHKAAVVEQIRQVLPRGALAGLTAFGDRLWAALVGQVSLSLQYFV